jgi:hypothetical protein
MAAAWMANDQIAENLRTLTWLQNSQTPAKGPYPGGNGRQRRLKLPTRLASKLQRGLRLPSPRDLNWHPCAADCH